MKIEDGVWTEPALAAFERSSKSDSPFLTPDGNTMFFMSGDNSGIERIWQVDREAGEWGSPRKLAEEVNQYGAHWQASMAANGNLYFSSKGEIFCSKFIDGTYLNAQKLDFLINTENAYEGSPFIAADGSYLIFDRAENYSDADLYITFKNSDGSWDEPVEMKVLNTGAHDLYANVSPDGRFIMFLSGRMGGILLPYWVDAGLIEELRTSDGQKRLGQ